jgi:ABC-type sugar transport system ATPase subunit
MVSAAVAEGGEPSATASGAALPGGAAVLEVRDLSKRYGGVHALSGASLRLSRPGVVHCLIGENGSGKSTLLNVLSGQVKPDSGEVLLDGAPADFSTPPEAVRAGIAMVSQETAIAPHLSIAENILLGERLIRRYGRIDWASTRKRAAEVLTRLNLDYDVSLEVSKLRPDQRQMVEIARALSIDARVLILDEPTSFLSEDEVERLFAAVRQLSANGVSTIFVSHRLPELFAIADEVTVLRDGRTVSSGAISEYDTDRLIHDMVGEVKETPPPPAGERLAAAAAAEHPRLRASELSDGVAIRQVSLEVGPGEIVGVAGLAGSGRSELLEMIFGALPAVGGKVEIDGKDLGRVDPTKAIAAGVGFVPAERKVDGVVLTMSVFDNLAMAESADASWWKPPRRGRSGDEMEQTIEALRVKTDTSGALVGTLSGGNQQKVALGKWLVNKPTLLLLEEPTRGVDVRAKSEIHALLRELAVDGVGLLVSSSENDELLGLCDRILVMYQGTIVSSMSADEASELELARLSGGSKQ